MAGMAGIAQPGRRAQVSKMLDRIRHRGPAGSELVEAEAATLGLAWVPTQARLGEALKQEHVARDEPGAGHGAQAGMTRDGFSLKRDPLGVTPLYYGRADDGALCFASEVKALLAVTRDVHEVPPGHQYDGRALSPYFQLSRQPELDDPPEQLAGELRRRLSAAVEKRIGGQPVGGWLSGGLDSSAMAALARPHVGQFHTFAAGLDGAPDLEHARAVADFIGSRHHEVVVGPGEILAVLSDVIFHLESFDALLVRSSLTNYLVARCASDYVPEVFSGEGGDELFAGYEYLKGLRPEALPDELIDITGRLHNTALQRVDRCAAAHGTLAHVAFLDPEVVDLALRIPASLKLRDGVEKWILRQAMQGALPETVLQRTKAKFWEGAGVGERMAQYADERIPDDEFARERNLPNGWTLNTKEELLYYRIFRRHFGDLDDLSWMGRTKGAPEWRPA